MRSRLFLVLGVTVLVLGLFLTAPGKVFALTEAEIIAKMAEVNELLADMGENFRLEAVEYYTEFDKVGQIVYFDDRTLQSGVHWVPGDPRRGGRTNITWLSDQVDGTASGLTIEATQAALGNAMDTWNSVTGVTIPLSQATNPGIDLGYVQWLAGYGGYPGLFADIIHAGWLPGEFFDYWLGPGSSSYVLGLTFIFGFNPPTDIDNNGKLDVWFTETYYNNTLPWGINTDSPIDVETIVLHETGHALSLGHFGKLFQIDANGKFHFAPQAVMNAGYSGVQQELKGTDSAAFHSVWGGWPDYE